MELRDLKYETAHETLTLNANFSCSSAKVILLYNKVTSCLSSAGVVAWRHSQGYYWNQLTEISMAEISCRCTHTHSKNIQIHQFVWERENHLVLHSAASKNSVQKPYAPLFNNVSGIMLSQVLPSVLFRMEASSGEFLGCCGLLRVKGSLAWCYPSA